VFNDDDDRSDGGAAISDVHCISVVVVLVWEQCDDFPCCRGIQSGQASWCCTLVLVSLAFGETGL